MSDLRSRSYTWADPKQHAATLGSQPGLAMLRAMAAGELPPPPIMVTLDFFDFTPHEGRVSVRMTPQEFQYNPLGSVHGGVIAAILDTAAGCAVHSTLPAGVGYTTLDLTTRYLRPVTMDSGTLLCEGTVISSGRRTALAEALLTDELGRLLAHATSTCLIFPIPSAG
jgi:uncharacterized protein (TIGR00369 family)